MKTGAPSLQALSLAIFLGLLTSAGAYVGLAACSQPENFRNRVTNLQDRVAMITRLSRASPAGRAYRPGALCPAADAERLTVLTSELQARAGALGLTTVSLAVTPAAQPSGQVSRVALQVEVTGAYEATTAFLGGLAGQTPKIFADRVDLIDRGAKTSLRFAGHFYCSTAT